MKNRRNSNLQKTLTNLKPQTNLVAAQAIPKEDSTNVQGHVAYALDKFSALLNALNTLKLEPQYYKTQSSQVSYILDLIDKCATENAYYTAQMIVWSRCVSKAGMRAISHLSAARMAKYLSNREWSRYFYTNWNKKEGYGGIIFRADDAREILDAYIAINTLSPDGNVKLPNSIRKGFKQAIESLDTYSFCKYKGDLLDLINIVHPDPAKSKSFVNIPHKVYVEKLTALLKATKSKDKAARYTSKIEKLMLKSEDVKVPCIEALIIGLTSYLTADTWETAQSEAGQVVAKAIKEGKLTEEAAAEVLEEAKNENWVGLLTDNKLGYLAALRNIRNILLTAKGTVVKQLCNLLSQADKIRTAKIHPMQIDIAAEVVVNEFSNSEGREVLTALNSSYTDAIPNLKEVLTGRTLIAVDTSGSMTARVDVSYGNKRFSSSKSCLQKSALIAATFAKGLNADVILFDTQAVDFPWSPNQDVFAIGNNILNRALGGGTNISTIFSHIQSKKRAYDRIIILSDNEANRGTVSTAYQNYVKAVCDPYVYAIDLASYGTIAVKGPKVKVYAGYSFQTFEDMMLGEFNPNYHMEKVKAIRFTKEKEFGI
jgi:60 kDa SS-A/Ro ribonucleoprotein